MLKFVSQSARILAIIIIISIIIIIIYYYHYPCRSREMNETVVTLAHELAHSFGSKHDEDVSI